MINHIKPISFTLLAFILSWSALIPATATGQTKDVKAEAALENLKRSRKISDAEMEARNDALDLKNARLEADNARLHGKPVDSRKVAQAAAKVEADRRQGLHPDTIVSIKENLAVMAAFMDCSVAIVDKHNRDFPAEPWASETSFRDSMVGKPDADRLQKANACLEHRGIIQP